MGAKNESGRIAVDHRARKVGSLRSAASRRVTAAGSTPEAKRLEQTWKDLELAGRVSTETVPQVATPAEDGPVLREAKQFAEALRRVRQGDVGEALAPNGNHKLPSHIVYG